MYSSDSEKESPVKSILQQNENDDEIDLLNDEIRPLIRPSYKLDIVEQHTNINNKFSIWSDILLEEQLNETLDRTLKISEKHKNNKNRLIKNLSSRNENKDSDNYFIWSKKDFEKKFANTTERQIIKKKKRKYSIVMDIATKLKESRTDLIKNVIEVLGEAKARHLVAEVLDIEQAGGIMTSNNSRRRSPGGVLFYLIKKDSTITDEQKHSIFGDKTVKEITKKVKKFKRQKNKRSQRSIMIERQRKRNRKQKKRKKKSK